MSARDEIVGCQDCGGEIIHPAPGTGGTWRHRVCPKPAPDPIATILAMPCPVKTCAAAGRPCLWAVNDTKADQNLFCAGRIRAALVPR